MALTLLGIFPKGDKPHGLLFFVLTVLALFLTLAVHEAGHLFAGLLQGFRFELFVVGLLGIKRENHSIRIFLNKNIGYMGGITATVPRNPAIDNRRKFAYMLIAGPLASLLFAAISFVAFSTVSSGAAKGFWLVAGATSIAIFLATTLPTKTGAFFTDRGRFQRLISKGKTGAAEAAILTILAHYVADGSCKNIPLDKVGLLHDDNDKVVRFWGSYYTYYYYKDNDLQSETAIARINLYSLKDSIPSSLWKSLKIDEVSAA